VNVRAIIDDLTEGQAEPARGPLVPALAYTDTTPVLAFDPRAAARALEAAGWHDEDRDGVRDRRGAHLAFHILVSDNDPLRLAIAARVSRDLARIGVAAEVRELPVEQLVPRLQSGAFEAFMGMWYPDPGLDLDPIWYSESTDRMNYGGYASAGADSLLDQLRHEIDPDRRAQLLTVFQRRVYADQPYLFLVQNPRFVALSRRVHGADLQVLSTFWNLPRWWIPRDLQAEPAPSAADSTAS
jgi:peptide/nickel transport system substrate-binding protein